MNSVVVHSFMNTLGRYYLLWLVEFALAQLHYSEKDSN